MSSYVGWKLLTYVELRRLEKILGKKKSWAPEGALALIHNSYVVCMHLFYPDSMT